MKRSRPHPVTIALTAVLLIASILHAHLLQQVNTQINPELYGHGTTNSIKYNANAPSSMALPSEVRHAYWQSGALPSDVRMGYAQLGPLATTGAMAYVPPPPSYLAKPSTPMPTPAAMPASTYNPAATIRYSSPAAGSGYVPAQSYSAAPVGGPINAGPINTSIRYAR